MTDIITSIKEILCNKYKSNIITYLGEEKDIKFFTINNNDIIVHIYNISNINEENKSLLYKKLDKNMYKLHLVIKSVFVPFEISTIGINGQEFWLQSFSHLKNKDIIDTLINKFGNKKINYIGKGSEAKVFSINDDIIIKVYCRRISLKKNQDVLLHEITKQMSDLQGIDGLLKPLEINTIQIGNFEILTQSFKYMKNKSLFDVITNKNVDYRCLFPFIIKISLDLFYLHQAGFIHYDLKLENIFLNEKGNPKIGDFGFLERIGLNKIVNKGSVGYAAPEMFEKNYSKTSYKSDIYSLGIIFYCLIIRDKNSKSLKNFFKEDKVFDYIKYNSYLLMELETLILNETLRKKIRLFGKDEIKLEFLILVRNMISFKSEYRPNIEQVIEKIANIFLLTKENYTKYEINGQEHDFQIKNKEQLILFSENYVNAIDLNFKTEEIKKMEKNIGKRILSFLESDDMTDEFKYSLSESLDKIFPNNDFIKFNNEISSKIYKEEQEVLDKIKKQMDTLKRIKICYTLHNEESYDIDDKLKFCDTLSSTLDEFNIFKKNQTQSK